MLCMAWSFINWRVITVTDCGVSRSSVSVFITLTVDFST